VENHRIGLEEELDPLWIGVFAQGNAWLIIETAVPRVSAVLLLRTVQIVKDG
jgi:hypothetical protein